MFCIESKTVRVGETRQPPWLNYNEVKKVTKSKNTMWEKFKQSKLPCDRLLFGQANKEYNKAMVEAQIKHEKTLAESLKETPKRFYNQIRNCVKTDTSVDYLITADGEQITDHFDMAE